jgi:hypothetical protein
MGTMVTRQANRARWLTDPDYFMYWKKPIMRPDRRVDIRFAVGADAAQSAYPPDSLGPTTLYYMTRNRLLFAGTRRD